MDVVFDIDGTLASATHRLHFIKTPGQKADWKNFLSNEQVAMDAPIPQTWQLLESLMYDNHRCIFITGRKESTRLTTFNWLYDENMKCSVRSTVASIWSSRQSGIVSPVIYMRDDDDHRESSIVKGELLERARMDGFDPKLVFEDRIKDTAMWRAKGLLCCQVADGDY